MKKSIIVNMYLIRKMLGYETIVEVQRDLDAEYYNRSYSERNISYAEYVDYRRNKLAEILGILKYTNEYV